MTGQRVREGRAGTVTIRDRFESFALPEPNSGCWLWTSSVIKSGYGTIWADGGPQRAHRISWELHRGPIPPGLDVLHRCDVRCCVNPDHLWLGTDVDNQRDCIAKGRRHSCRGVAHHKNKLTEQQVLAIRADSRGCKRLSRQYGVSTNTILCIRRGEIWKHLL